MRYTITITVPKGPTIMAEDVVPVTFSRMAATPEQVSKIQKAAIELGAVRVDINDEAAARTVETDLLEDR